MLSTGQQNTINKHLKFKNKNLFLQKNIINFAKRNCDNINKTYKTNNSINTVEKRQQALRMLLEFADAHYITDPNFKFNRADCYDR